AALERALRGEGEARAPGADARLGLVLEHLRAALDFYGEALGLRVFRKHLGWYVEQAPWPEDAPARRAAKARLCRLDTAAAVEAALADLWLGGGARAQAA
ncbi:MAG: tRNA-dihydrouridine synthase, partial [Caulobacteraceae bacterium]|nr:tRNA-dihydrouridine synthase [Caulobacter sp.]